MEAAPPSYEAAILKDVWQLVAPHLTTKELCAAARVSRRWHRTFAAQLWAVPTSHFGLEFNGVLDHLARFQRALDIARASTRSFTYCLRLIPSQALYFDERPRDWFKRLLDLLPNLQALLVPGVSYFDHDACQALRGDGSTVSAASKASSTVDSHSLHELRLLDASRCHNLTSVSLVNAMSHLTSLIYLDLSHCHSAKDKLVFQAIGRLHGLKVLKLKSIRLTDEDVLLLAGTIGRRVCSLDLRDNQLTDRAVDALLESCFQHDTVFAPREEHLDVQIYRAYTTGTVNRLTIEDVQERGIVELAIANNALSETSLSRLLNHTVLQHLDIGRLKQISIPQLLVRRQGSCPLLTLRVDSRVVRAGSTGPFLRPELLGRVSELTLTNVPTYSQTQQTASSLVDFIKACAHEAHVAMRLARSDYAGPPGQRNTTLSIDNAAQQIFAMRTIVLEVTQDEADVSAASLTGDEDSDALWSAGQSDFSFFRDEDGSSSNNDKNKLDLQRSASSRREVDNLALLAAFRSERRRAHELVVHNGQADAYTTGYWPGTILVRRAGHGS